MSTQSALDFYAAQHKRRGEPLHMVLADVVRYKNAERDIMDLMDDGLWHTREELQYATGQAEATRRLRDLRKKLEYTKYKIEMKRDGNVFLYRMVNR